MRLPKDEPIPGVVMMRAIPCTLCKQSGLPKYFRKLIEGKVFYYCLYCSKLKMLVGEERARELIAGKKC